MKMNSSRPRSVALVALFATAVVACGGGGGHCATAGGVSGGGCAARAGVKRAVNDTGSKAAGGSTIDIEAQDVKFSPTCTTSVPSGTVTLTIHNSGSLLHNISIPDQHIDHDIAVGATVTVQVDVGAAPVTYFCKYHRGGGMVGVLVPA